jgi:hypothetical protein
MYEHTDGLIYNTDFLDMMIFHLFKIQNTDKIQINLTEGVGVGLPKRQCYSLGKRRYDDFHVSGYGTSLKLV